VTAAEVVAVVLAVGFSSLVWWPYVAEFFAGKKGEDNAESDRLDP